MRKGSTKAQSPVYIPDLGVGEFANSGFREHIRFLRSADSIGAYSLIPGARSKTQNCGAIVQISDTNIKYLVCPASTRQETLPSPKDSTHGPLLPHSVNPKTSGTISVTASIEKASEQPRSAVDKVLLDRNAFPKPGRWPFFWTYKNRLTEWLMQDSGPVFYEVSGNTATVYLQLVRLLETMNQKGGNYIDHAERFIYGNESRKGYAGAEKLMDRQVMEVGAMICPHFHLNFLPATFATQSGHIYFMPDEVIITDITGQCLFVAYSELSYQITEGTHMGVPVPTWAVPVAYSWQFMNKDGGPDRRYNNNYQIPHYKVWELDFTFPGGRIDAAFMDYDLLRQFTSCIDKLRNLEKNRK